MTPVLEEDERFSGKDAQSGVKWKGCLIAGTSAIDLDWRSSASLGII